MEPLRVLIAGDIFPREQLELFARGETEKLFADEVAALFRNADFSIANLEGVLTETNTKCPKCGPNIKAPPETANALKALGLNYVTLANNHSSDYGKDGYRDTVETLEKLGIGYFGAGENISKITTHIRVQIKETTIVFYTVAETVFNIPSESAPGSNLYDEYRVCKEIEELKKQCDYLFVLYHGGVEFFQYPTPWVQRRFHRMADSGADVIIAQHTHCIGTEEYYGDKYLLYGQGNFYFLQPMEKEMTSSGLLLQFILTNGSVSIERYPIYKKDGKLILYPQLMQDFEIRNKRLADGESFEKEFNKYTEKWLAKWLMEFRGLRFSDRLIRKLLGDERFLQYLRRQYKDYTVLRMLEHVRGEEDLEVMQRGLQRFWVLGTETDKYSMEI